MSKNYGIIFFLLILFNFPVFTQEISPQGNSEKTLFEETLYNDINTASYYELINWCRELSLDDKGDSDTLKNQLYSYYQIDINAQFLKENNNSTIVKIVSADSTEYYSIEEIDEEYIRISGRVKLIVKQGGKNITHTIEADSVVFNQTTDSMTANGNILYIKEENGKEEEYTGDNFTFNVQNWKGVILKGDFKKTQEVNGKELEFIFSGESINKGEGDVVVLHEGSISSCEVHDKHYQIKAQKIWILGPDEWAILSGVLYVGHVPLLYLPFYHLPGNDMFFNPAIGHETRKGYFIQTSSYLLGEKQSTGEDDSFFINVADSDESYNLVPQGLFLFKEKGEIEEKESDYIKYKLDYYSRLGGYTGLEGSISKLWEFKTINFDIGLAVSKSIMPSQSGGSSIYTNYFSENNYLAQWNSSNLFGVDLPFRWGLSFNFTFYTFTANFEYITDPWFESDFNNREENFDWLNYLLAQTTADEDVDESSTSSLDWSITGNLSIPDQWADNYITSFSFNPVKLNILWSKKYNPNYFTDDNVANDSRPYDPGRMFFYPDSMTLPQTTLNLSGVLLDFSTNSGFTLPEQNDTDEGTLKSPWADKKRSNNSKSQDEGQSSFIEPGKLDDISISDDYEAFSTKIDYRLNGYFNYIAYTDSTTWTELDQIDFNILKSTFTNNNTLSINYSFNFMNQVFVLSGTNSFVSNYLKYFGDVNSDETTKEKQNQKLKWLNNLDFKIFPLKTISYMEKSSINYQFNTNIYRREYDTTSSSFKEYWIDWDEESISAHKASVNFDFTVPFLTTTLLFDTSLPPRDIEQSITPGLSISFFNWTNTINVRALYKDNDWSLDPLNYTSVFIPIDEITLSEQLIYSFEDETLTSSISKIQLWDFSAVYNMAYTTDYEWDKDNLILIDNGKAFIPSSLSIAYNLHYESPLLWKNRIKMDLSLNTSLNMNLQQYNLSSLIFELSYNLHIYKFLDFSITLSTSNDHMFLYFPSLRDYYGINTEYSFFGDLFKSFNIFSPNQKDRYDSFFNMNFIKVSLVHKLHDWDLELTYDGKPLIESSGGGGFTTRWDSTLSILVRWNPIEKIKVKVDHANEDWSVDTEFNE